ncbi:hypothetical protein AAVH_43318, partial [Aphelenchoides avenae]
RYLSDKKFHGRVSQGQEVLLRCQPHQEITFAFIGVSKIDEEVECYGRVAITKKDFPNVSGTRSSGKCTNMVMEIVEFIRERDFSTQDACRNVSKDEQLFILTISYP